MQIDSKEDGLTNIEYRDGRSNLIRYRSQEEMYLVFRFFLSRATLSLMQYIKRQCTKCKQVLEKNIVETELTEMDGFP